MKKISFVIMVILTPVFTYIFSYLFMEKWNMRPEGVPLSILLTHAILTIFILIILFLNLNKQIQVAIDRFTENQEKLEK